MPTITTPKERSRSAALKCLRARSDHVTLQVRSADRLFFEGYMARLQTHGVNLFPGVRVD